MLDKENILKRNFIEELLWVNGVQMIEDYLF
jgi:hypothetical protein